MSRAHIIIVYQMPTVATEFVEGNLHFRIVHFSFSLVRSFVGLTALSPILCSSVSMETINNNAQI